jgi:hypothetical protein
MAGNHGHQRPCRRCGQPYTAPPGSRDPLCLACRELVAAWHSPERLTALAQQGFEEAMGMRPPSGMYADLPADAGLRAQRWQPGDGAGPQQMLGWSDTGGAWISESEQDAAVPGQVRCRHCAAVLAPGPDGSWTDPGGSAGCFSPGIVHEPLPGGLDGSPAC